MDCILELESHVCGFEEDIQPENKGYYLNIRNTYLNYRLHNFLFFDFVCFQFQKIILNHALRWKRKLLVLFQKVKLPGLFENVRI